MITTTIDNKGTLNFINNRQNYDIFTKISEHSQHTSRIGNIEVFAALPSQQQKQLLISNKRIDPNSFWVIVNNELIGPFTYREDAVLAEETRLRRLGCA